ncbi:MAG TPA: hypothetical protein VMY42_04980 [Thermoguttaceae bacterium]|nr:hypothetical protein [Thermoguttaceae bacterium]
MSRLDQEHDVVALARELGLRGHPAEAIVRFCEEKIGCWAADVGGVENVAVLEQLVADRLQLVFEEGCSDDDLERIIAKYVAQGEYVFATLRNELGPATFGLTIKRKHCAPESGDKYVAVIDSRGEKASRRFFTRWHEIAHLLVLEKELDAPVRRSAHDPIERLMDEIAGRIGFYEPLFGPVFVREHSKALLEFRTVEAVRNAYCDKASFQSTLFACHRRMKTPVVYVEAEVKYKAEEERRLRSKQRRLFQDDPPVAKLRVGLAVPNQAAIDQGFRVMPNMRVPEGSVIHKLHSDADAEQASGRENLESWEFSDGSGLPDCAVWVDARKAGDRVIAIVQPVD